MIFFFFLLLIIVVIVIISVKSGKKNSCGHYSGYVRDYDEDDFEDYETMATMGKRDFFTDDPARNYDSYYAQIADDAMMGDESAMEEMRDEFGEGEW